MSSQDYNNGRFGGGGVIPDKGPAYHDFLQGKIQGERDAAAESQRQERARAENAKWIFGLNSNNNQSGTGSWGGQPTVTGRHHQTSAAEGLYRLLAFGLAFMAGWYGFILAEWASLTGWWALGTAGLATTSGWWIVSCFKSPLVRVFQFSITLARWMLIGGLGLLLFSCFSNRSADSSDQQGATGLSGPIAEPFAGARNGAFDQTLPQVKEVQVESIDDLNAALADRSTDRVTYNIRYADFGGGYFIPEHAKTELSRVVRFLKTNPSLQAHFVVRGHDIMAATTRTSDDVQRMRGSVVAKYVVSQGANRNNVSYSGGASQDGSRYIEVRLTQESG